jgi:uncharacterized repeat protein (TIGR03803 family)
MDAAGNLFGTTSAGGAFGDGTVFEIAWNGSSYASAPAVLATFNNASGFHSVSSLTLDAAGNLIGTAAFGGTNFSGTVFEIAKTGTGYAKTPTTMTKRQRVTAPRRPDRRRRREPVRRDGSGRRKQ